MISFFSSTLPSRLLGLIVVGICIFMVQFLAYNVESLWLMRIFLNADLVSGGKTLYSQIYDYIAPMTVLFATPMVSIFEKSLEATHFFSLIIILFNSVYFNNIIDKYRLIAERTFIPGLLYFVLSSSFLFCYEISAGLLAALFLNLSISSILKMGLENADSKYQAFNSGIFIGLAAFCQQTFSFFLIAGLIALLYYTPASFKHFLMLILGFLLPFITVLNFYLFKGEQSLFTEYFLSKFINGDSIYNVNLFLLFPFAILSFLIISYYFIMKLQTGNFINYINKAHQIFMIWFLIGVSIILFGKDVFFTDIHLLISPLAFFLTFIILKLRKKVMREVMFFLLLFYCITFNSINFNFGLFGYEKIRKYIAVIDKTEYDVYDGTVLNLNLDDNVGFYKFNKCGSYFSNVHLEKKAFLNIHNPENLIKIYEGLHDDLPAYVLDEDGIFKAVLEQIPEFEKQYILIRKGVYKMKN